MEIIEIKVLRGPNIWSIRRKNLIVLKLDIGDFEERPTNDLPGFGERLQQILPSLYEHTCSEGHKGGFFERVKEGTWIGHVVEHIALEIQTIAGMDCGFGRTRSTNTKGVYNVVFSYIVPEAGIYAAKAAVKIAQLLAENSPIDLQEDIKVLRQLYTEKKLGPSTEAIVSEAIKLNIPFLRLNNASFVQLGYGAAQKRIVATVTSHTSNIGVDIAGDKSETKEILRMSGIPVPAGITIEKEEDLANAIETLKFPLVIKPLDSNHGKGVTTRIQNGEEARQAFHQAIKYSSSVIVEQFHEGHDYRLLVVNHKLVAAAKRIPAKIIGDGISSIRTLIAIENEDPRRGNGHDNLLTKIELDGHSMQLLAFKNLTPESILEANQMLYLKQTANLSTGGTAEDVTDIVHRDNVFMAERISCLVGLDICGIDIISPDIAMPLFKNGAIVEVNAGPGFRMHTAPSSGKPRNVGKAVVDMLFPDPSKSRIPIVAVTGTNGKTTTTRLIAHILRKVYNYVGYTTTDGIYINDHLLEEGDCTGPKSAEQILRDPTVELAVLECARGGLLRAGLAFDQCDTGVVTNVAEDHLGLKDIHSLEDMAKVKAVIPESVHKNGFAVLNADNYFTYSMASNLTCKVAFFSRDPHNPYITNHCLNGGIASVEENGYVTILDGSKKIRIASINEIPLSYEGKAGFMIENILAAVLSSYVNHIDPVIIQSALYDFFPSPEITPGRLNIFNFRHFKVLVDYAHNPHGMNALGDFIAQFHSGYKLGILTGVGDRRDGDIRLLGSVASSIFDEIIIRLDEDLRGRQKKEIISLMQEGIQSHDPFKPIHLIANEFEALAFAIKHVKDGCMIVHLCEDVKSAIESIRNFREMEKDNSLEGLSLVEI